jgi:hypothetical protein
MSDNKIRELTVDELDSVSGGSSPSYWADWSYWGIDSQGGAGANGIKMPGMLQS